jgi:hypothetical protein
VVATFVAVTLWEDNCDVEEGDAIIEFVQQEQQRAMGRLVFAANIRNSQACNK